LFPHIRVPQLAVADEQRLLVLVSLACTVCVWLRVLPRKPPGCSIQATYGHTLAFKHAGSRVLRIHTQPHTHAHTHAQTYFHMVTIGCSRDWTFGTHSLYARASIHAFQISALSSMRKYTHPHTAHDTTRPHSDGFSLGRAPDHAKPLVSVKSGMDSASRAAYDGASEAGSPKKAGVRKQVKKGAFVPDKAQVRCTSMRVCPSMCFLGLSLHACTLHQKPNLRCRISACACVVRVREKER
jgi:hypothetical protein